MKHDSSLALVFATVALTTACTVDSDAEDTGAESSSGATAGTMPPSTGNAMDDMAADDVSTSDGTDTGMPAETDDTMAGDSTAAGDTAADTTVGDTDGDESSDGGSTGDMSRGATVTGTVFRDAGTDPGAGLDAIGDVYLGLLISCDQDAATVASTVVMGADLSNPDNGETFAIDGVPDGTYFLAGFMDDNGNADPDNPDADLGDLAAVDGFAPACTQVDIVAGGDVMGADITLNFVVPF